MRSVDHSFYTSKRWRKAAKAYLKSQNGLCELCRAEGKYTPAEIVHHKEHLTADNFHDEQIKFSWDNLQALCLQHHNKIHFSRKEGARRYEIDENGKLIF